MRQRLYIGRADKVYARFPNTPGGAVTVDVARADGTVLVNNGATVSVGDNVYSYQLTLSHLDRHDCLNVTFTDGVTANIWDEVDVVGRPYFEVQDVWNAAITEEQFDADAVARVRAAVESQIESNLGTSCVGRFVSELDVEIHATRRRARLAAPYVREIVSVYEADVAVDPTAYRLRGRYMERVGGPWYGILDVDYIEGIVAAPPGDLREAAVEATRENLFRSTRTGAPPQAIMLTTEVGTAQLAVAGLRHPFGLPTVDAVVLHYVHEFDGDL